MFLLGSFNVLYFIKLGECFISTTKQLFKSKNFPFKAKKKCNYIIKCVYKLSQLNGPDKET